jgi:Fe2+ transport system protein FeoA
MKMSRWRKLMFKTCPQPCENPVCLEEHPAPGSYPENCYLPLSMVAPGESVRLVRIAAGHRLRRRLTELGLIPGVEFKIMQDDGGPLLLAVKDTRLALGRGMAHKIIVQTA